MKLNNYDRLFPHSEIPINASLVQEMQRLSTSSIWAHEERKEPLKDRTCQMWADSICYHEGASIMPELEKICQFRGNRISAGNWLSNLLSAWMRNWAPIWSMEILSLPGRGREKEPTRSRGFLFSATPRTDGYHPPWFHGSISILHLHSNSSCLSAWLRF